MLFDKLIAKGTLYDLGNAFELLRDQESKTVVDGEVQFTSDFYDAHEKNKALRAKIVQLVKGSGEGIDLYYRSLLFDAPYDFDSYCLYLEHKRERAAQFYINRRKQLRPVVQALQGLADDEYDLVTVSLPPGVGKSTLALFYLTWRAGRDPSKSILGVSHSTEFVAQAYKECLRIITDPEYCWGDVFPKVPLVSKNAEYQRIDLGSAKRFETLEFTSTDSKNAGMFRAQQLLYCDDLVASQEQALSSERMDKLWSDTYSVDIEQRRQGRPGELHIATRWSVHDVIGRLQEINEGNPRAKFIQINALDEDGESNFDYPYNLGFSTESYRKLKEVMDDASWSALYMNEPYERKGLLYPPDKLRRFTELPGDPDGVVSVCDTKAKGSDFCVMPIAYLYGRDCYIADVLCDNGDPGTVETALVNILLKHNVKRSRFESNAAGWKIAESVSDRVKAAGGYCSVETKWSQSNKETKIQVEQPWVIDHCLFLTEDKQSQEYKTFMKQLCSYVQNGKNKHDDVPDAMAQLSQFVQGVGGSRASVIKRPF